MDLDIELYRTKGGAKKLKKDNFVLYAELIHHTDTTLKPYYTRHIPLILRILVAKNGNKVDDDMLCLCKTKTTYSSQTQDFTKKFCSKCSISSFSNEYFKLKYGDNWEYEAVKYRYTPDRINQRARSGRKSFESRRSKIFNGSIATGANESSILDYLELINNITIKRGYTIDGYYPDGYCEETNTIYEVYERYHLSCSKIMRDLRRQKDIQSALKCDFVVIYDIQDQLDLEHLTIQKYTYV